MCKVKIAHHLRFVDNVTTQRIQMQMENMGVGALPLMIKISIAYQ